VDRFANCIGHVIGQFARLCCALSPMFGIVIALPAARTKRGVTKAMLFAKAILRAEFEANAPFREALRIKRERLQAKRAAKKANDAYRDDLALFRR
jgi:hypothetical protein